jgi:dienelactone hydrolase
MRYMLWFSLMLLAGLANAAVVSQVVDYQDENTRLKGQVFWDDALTGKRPGVLLIPEWWGLNAYAQQRAGMLAELGYVAFAADMYGDGKVTKDPKQAQAWMEEVIADPGLWRQRANAALAALTQRPQTDAARLASIGYCFGGGTVLQMAYGGGYGLKGVVSFHGSLPAAPKDSQGKIAPRILIFHGQADSFLPTEVVNQFQSKLEESGARWEMVSYGGVRHSFTNPKVGEYGIANLKYDPTADRRSWTGMREFLNELFSETAP